MPKVNISDSDGDKYTFDVLTADNQKLNSFTQTKSSSADRLTKTIKIHGPISPTSAEKDIIDEKLWSNLRSALSKGSFFGKVGKSTLGADVQVEKGELIDATRRWYELVITVDYDKTI